MTTGTAPDRTAARRGRATGRIWLVSGGVADRIGRQLAVGGDAVVESASLEHVIASAGCGDWSLLAGLSPAETVTAAEALLPLGVRVAVEAGAMPALRHALGRKLWGLDCVVLSPEPSTTASAIVLRLRDVLVSAAALVVLSPLLGILAALVRLSSPGPIFYTAPVVGRDGRVFTWRKLRSMRVGSAEDDARRRERYRAFLAGQQTTVADGGTQHKIVDDSRVTGIGRVLRRHSLDELPQLWNVLVGNMTLVGPRPCLPYEYELQEPWHRLRYRVSPGLTGPWQAYGRSRVTFDEMALMDYCYSRVKSFWLDLRLILRTVLVVVSGEGGK